MFKSKCPQSGENTITKMLQDETLTGTPAPSVEIYGASGTSLDKTRA